MVGTLRFAHPTSSLDAVDRSTRRADILDCGCNGLVDRRRLPGKIEDDEPFLIDDDRVITSGIIEAIAKVVRIRIDTRGDNTELKRFHRPRRFGRRPRLSITRPLNGAKD